MVKFQVFGNVAFGVVTTKLLKSKTDKMKVSFTAHFNVFTQHFPTQQCYVIK